MPQQPLGGQACWRPCRPAVWHPGQWTGTGRPARQADTERWPWGATALVRPQQTWLPQIPPGLWRRCGEINPTTATSATPFSSCPQSFPTSGSSPVTWLFTIRWPKYPSFNEEMKKQLSLERKRSQMTNGEIEKWGTPHMSRRSDQLSTLEGGWASRIQFTVHQARSLHCWRSG